MSIRTNPMKAVPTLLKRVKTARRNFHEWGRDESLDGKLGKLSRELNKIDDLFMKVKKNQDELLDTLTEVDGHLRKLDKKRLNQEMDDICKRIRYSAHKFLPMDSFDDESSESEQDPKKGSEIVHPSHDPSSTQRYNNQLQLPQPPHVNLNLLEDLLQYCLLCLSIFPKDAVIKKRQAIYLWIGWLNAPMRIINISEEMGEEVIDELLKLNMIVPYGNAKCPVVKKFKLNPHIRPQIESMVLRVNAGRSGFYFAIPPFRISLELLQKRVTLGDHFRPIDSVFNVGASYLNVGSRWLDLGIQNKDLHVLQLGRWQDSLSHRIEVGSQEFLKGLRHQKYLKYLSLRGISRIFALPPSILQLVWLEILDLKACHHLETLPDDISPMISLTHLILSQCYLLDGMPNGIDKLTQLQVLKGFVISSSRNTPCRISDLANLKRLRRLSIHIGTQAVIKDKEFESLGELSSLQHLKISWGVSKYSDIQIILPLTLKKLHLEGFPGQKIPEWLKPSRLPKLPHKFSEWLNHRKPPEGLKELNITGGKLESMNHDEDTKQWGIEIVRLKYLKHLQIDLTNLQELFPLLRYAEIKKISNFPYFEWSSKWGER